MPRANTIEDSGDSLVTGLLFLSMGVAAAFSILPRPYKANGWAALALMSICFVALLAGTDFPVRWRFFVETCFAIWAVLFALPFLRPERPSDSRDDWVR